MRDHLRRRKPRVDRCAAFDQGRFCLADALVALVYKESMTDRPRISTVHFRKRCGITIDEELPSCANRMGGLAALPLATEGDPAERRCFLTNITISVTEVVIACGSLALRTQGARE